MSLNPEELQQWSQDEINRVAGEICLKSSQNEEFRQLALSDPASAVKQISGRDVPAGFGLKFIENDPGVHMTVVLPNMQSDELSESDLEQIAGGACAANAEACGAMASASVK